MLPHQVASAGLREGKNEQARITAKLPSELPQSCQVNCHKVAK
jgi:hypothetical protein